METVICIPVRDYQRSGTSGFLTSVVRALPVAVLRPVAGAAEALSYTLLGERECVCVCVCGVCVCVWCVCMCVVYVCVCVCV